MYSGLYDGGRAGMVYSFMWTAVGFLPIVASMAEMASMSPTSGGYVSCLHDKYEVCLTSEQTVPLGL